ncbi:MAG: ATP-grasp domain-containing protein [Deltaproteobacteria bacterium]|nr:ATP-grasp domain-containing protein [Deltaproteobacteria bacterium]
MPRNVVFVAPFPIETTMRFVRAASKLDDVRLLGVVHTPPDAGSPDARLYHDLVRVTEPLSVQDVIDGVEVLKRRHGQPYRVIGILEAMMVQMAEARERHGVAGTPRKTAELFRDKAKMKEALRAAGLPVARHKLVTSEADARAFAAEVGFPIVLKPPAGMGAKATFRVTSEESFVRAIAGMAVSERSPVLAEEFLRGREFSFETVTTGGKPRVSSISQYLPPCLEVLENPWIQWTCLLPKELDEPVYADAKKAGFAAIEALGLDDGMTHMEWFQRADGSVAIGEIAQRPPGANISLMTGIAHGIDPYRAWARAVVDGEFDAPWERKRAVGCAFLRGMGHGRVARVTGVHEVHEALGSIVAEAKLPTIGAQKADSYEGDGYVVVAHENTATVKNALKTIIETIRVEYAS